MRRLRPERLECTSKELRAAAVAARNTSEEAEETFKGLSLELDNLALQPATGAVVDSRWRNRLADGMLMGTLFSDGSGMHPRWANLRRAGWAAVQVDNMGNAVDPAYGPVPSNLCPMQVARDAENYAIAMLAQIAMPLFKVHRLPRHPRLLQWWSTCWLLCCRCAGAYVEQIIFGFRE